MNFKSILPILLVLIISAGAKDKFSFGVSDRGASIRIPISMPFSDWKGYLEDRRPASNADPYRIVSIMITTVSKVSI